MTSFPITVLLAIGMNASPARGEPRCVRIPDSATPVVTACESPDTYSFDIAGTRQTFAKAAYQQTLREAVSAWYEGVGVVMPSGAVLDLWLSVPEADPAATQMRVIVRGSSEESIFFTSIDPAAWVFSNADVGVITFGSYPDTFGIRAGQLLVKVTPASVEAAREALAEHACELATNVTPGWNLCAVPVFAERAIMSDIRGDDSIHDLVSDAAENSILEWIAHRAVAFSFAASPSH